MRAIVLLLIISFLGTNLSTATEYKTIILNTSSVSNGTIIEISSSTYPIPLSQWNLMNGSQDTRFTNIYGNITYPHYKIIFNGRTNYKFLVNLTDGTNGIGALRWTYNNLSLNDSSLPTAEETVFSDNFSTNGLGSTWLGDTGNFGISNNQLNMSVGVEARKAIYHEINLGVGTAINVTIKINETASTNYHEPYIGISDSHCSAIQLCGNGVSVGSLNYAGYLWFWRKTIANVSTTIGLGGTPDFIYHTHNLRYDGATWSYYFDGTLKGTLTGMSNFNESYVVLGDYSSLASKMFWTNLTVNTTSAIPNANTSVVVESGSWGLVAPKNTSLTITDLIRNITVMPNNEVYFGAGNSIGNNGRLLHWNQSNGTLEDVGGGLIGAWPHWQVLDSNNTLYIPSTRQTVSSGELYKWNSNNNTISQIVPAYSGGLGWYAGLWFNSTIYVSGTGTTGTTSGIIAKWNKSSDTWNLVAPKYGGVLIPGCNLITWKGSLYGGSDRDTGWILKLNETSGLLEPQNNAHDTTDTAFHWIIAYNETEMSEGTDTGDIYAGTSEPAASSSHGWLLKFNTTTLNMTIVANQFTGDGGTMTGVNTIWMMGGELYATLRNIAPTREVTVRWNGVDAWIQAAPHVPQELSVNSQLYSSTYWNGSALSGSYSTGNLYRYTTRRVLNPQNIYGTNGLVTWQKGLNTDNYLIYVNGSYITAVTTTQYSISGQGTKLISIRGHNTTYDSYTEWLNSTMTVDRTEFIQVIII